MQLVVLFGDPAQGCQVAKPLQNNHFSTDFLLSGESVDGMAYQVHSGLLESVNTDPVSWEHQLWTFSNLIVL